MSDFALTINGSGWLLDRSERVGQILRAAAEASGSPAVVPDLGELMGAWRAPGILVFPASRPPGVRRWRAYEIGLST